MTDTKTRVPYRKPLGTFIGMSENTERLYRLEEKREQAIKLAAEELGKLLHFTDFWRETMPEAILNILESYDREAVTLACQAYLEKKGE